MGHRVHYEGMEDNYPHYHSGCYLRLDNIVSLLVLHYSNFPLFPILDHRLRMHLELCIRLLITNVAV